MSEPSSPSVSLEPTGTSPINVPTLPPPIVDEHDDNIFPPPTLANLPAGGRVLLRHVENKNNSDTSPINDPTVAPPVLEERTENTVPPPF